MDAGMFEHPATQENIRILSGRGVTFAGPEVGRMASGLVGRGRFVEPVDLLGHARLALGAKGRLAGKKVIVTAGGTQEPIDPVRMLTNRSSGKQGYALAQAVIDAGGSVTLVSAPVSLPAPVGAQVVPVRTVEEMKAAVLSEASGVDALIMAAAASDFRPKKAADEKIKKQDGIPRIDLEAAPDILAAVNALRKGRPRIVVGFAAESRDLIRNAEAKLNEKKMDLIIANDITAADAGFGVDTNRVTLLFADGKKTALPLMGKDAVADVVIEHLAVLLENK
jgi:phosphopantothenoylcysteine decarboxylase/phosphopantothenate--cysteine ligase